MWGFKAFDKIDMIQNRAIRYFMGVHRFTPILATTGDMGWIVSTNRRWANVLRLWNRLVNMNETRLTRKVFDYDYSMAGGKNWCSDLKTILTKVDLLTEFYNKISVDLKNVENKLLENHKIDWSNKLQTVSKLRTNREFKSEYTTEKYLLATMTKLEKSHFAQFRCSILPLRVETGRYSGLSVHERTCTICTSNATEDEIHFLFNCSCYQDLRQTLIYKATKTKANFLLLNDVEKLNHVVENHFICVAKFIVDAMKRRKSLLYY